MVASSAGYGGASVVSGKVSAIRRTSNTSTTSSLSYGSGMTTSCSSSLEDSSLTVPPCTVSEITKAFQNEECCSLGNGIICEVHGQLPSKPTTPPSWLSSLDTRSRKLSCTRTGGVTPIIQPPLLQASTIQYTEKKQTIQLLKVIDADAEEEPFVMSLDGNNYGNFVDLETTGSPSAFVVEEGLGMVSQQAGQQSLFEQTRTRSMSACTDHSAEMSPERNGKSGRSRRESWSERGEKEETLIFELEV